MISLKQHGPWAVIPGGSEALGASFAQELGKAGFNLVLVARKEGPLEEVARAVRASSSVQVRTLALDLARPDMLDRIRQVTDDIEVGLLVYNAGASHRTGPFLDGSLEDALRTVHVNSVGHVSLCHHFGKKMVARKRGGIVIIGSLAGNAGGPGVVAYSAAKAFAQILVEGLWAEWKPKGIDVLYVPLGAMNSPSMARLGLIYGPEQMPEDPDDMAQKILGSIANGPVFVPPELVESFRNLYTPARREAVEGMMRVFQGATSKDLRSD